MSMPCSTKDCFMCQMENNEIKEMFYVDNRREESKKYSKSHLLKILNMMIGVVALLLLFNILISRKK